MITLLAELPQLKFGLNDFSSILSENTMKLHYTVLHAKYVEETNSVLAMLQSSPKKFLVDLYNSITLDGSVSSFDELLLNVQAKYKETYAQHSSNINMEKELRECRSVLSRLKFNIGGYINHNLLWSSLSTNKKEITGELLNAVNSEFKDLENFKKTLLRKCQDAIGPGWGWVAVKERKQRGEGVQLVVVSTKEHDTPLYSGYYPILAIDLWEHAYLLDYSFKGLRTSYLEVIYDYLNWDFALANYREYQNFRS